MRLASQISLLVLALCLAAAGGCGTSVPEGALVLTQTPPDAPVAPDGGNLLDARYPAGSRVILALSPFKPDNIRVLSKGLVAAGGPIVSPDGKEVVFSGKSTTVSAWQIYRATLSGGRPKALTALPAGAMDPAILPNGGLVFSSPVPKAGDAWRSTNRPALYSQAAGSPPRRITFGTQAAVEPTVLTDGRILFVSAQPSGTNPASPRLGLFTINNDGTEITAYAAEHDGADIVHRPRELLDGRIGFLAANSDARADLLWAEAVRTARPFASRTALLTFPAGRCRSVEPGGEGALLLSVESRGMADRSMHGNYGIYRLSPGATGLGQPVFDDPALNDIEAARLAPRPMPQGHISVMNETRHSGTLLCMDANRTTYPTNHIKAVRVRVLAEMEKGKVTSLGEVPLQADGSFMIEAPSDVPLGFEALDPQGGVLRRLPPSIWVRAGENRSCLGCHEPHNRSPRNFRPLAVNVPPVILGQSGTSLTGGTP